MTKLIAVVLSRVWINEFRSADWMRYWRPILALVGASLCSRDDDCRRELSWIRKGTAISLSSSLPQWQVNMSWRYFSFRLLPALCSFIHTIFWLRGGFCDLHIYRFSCVSRVLLSRGKRWRTMQREECRMADRNKTRRISTKILNGTVRLNSFLLERFQTSVKKGNIKEFTFTYEKGSYKLVNAK